MVAKGEIPQDERMEESLFQSGFPYISGPRSLEKDLAAHPYTSLYIACGGLSRFSAEAARELQKVLLPEFVICAIIQVPIAVVHPSNLTTRNGITTPKLPRVGKEGRRKCRSR